MKNFLLILSLSLLLISCEDKETESTITYPEVGFYGDNLLNDKTEYIANCDLSLAAELKGNSKLSIVITYLDGSIWQTSYTNNTIINRITIDNVQTFTSIHSNDVFDTWIIVFQDSHYRIDYYENGKLAKSKQITIFSDGCYSPIE